MQYFGDFPEDATVYIPFNTFSSNDPQASVTITNLVDADLKVHKDGSVTQIVTDGATIAIDFDTITGNHLATIDTSAHADYAIGSDYMVRMEGTTVDGGTINAWIGAWSIENRSSSLSATALANLILQYDTTGLSGDTFPSTQAQVAGIGTAGGAAINVDVNTSNEGGGITGVTSGTTIIGTPTNTYTATSILDGTYHTITHATNAIDVVYQLLTGGGTEPVAVVWTGYLTSANDTLTIDAWDHVGGAWETIGSIAGTGGTTNSVVNPVLFTRHRGTSAAELGKVYVRLHGSGLTSPVLNTDQLYLQYSITARSVGYANGSIWINTVNGVAGTENFVNGVADNPSDSMTDAHSIASSLNMHKFEVAGESSITFATEQDDHVFEGKGYTIALGGQRMTDAHISGASVSGTATTAGDEIHFSDCEMGACTLGGSHFHNCGLTDTITLSEATTYTFQTCHSEIAGAATPTIDFGAALGNTSLNMRRYSGGIEIQNMGATGTDTMSLEGNGALVINANSTGGTIVLRGDFSVTGAAAFTGAGGTITYDDNTASIKAIEADTNELQTDDVPGLIAALNDVAATDIVSGGAINTTGGAVDTITDVTNEVSSNVNKINDVVITGDGSTTPFNVV